MAARAEELGDVGDSAPEHWEPGLGTGAAHVLVTLYGVDEEALERVRAKLEATFDDAVKVVHEQRSETLPEGRDHFGFKDGIAQPALSGGGAEARPGDGLPNKGGGWREIAPGEFILGYQDEDGGLPLAPMAPFDRNSTYVVYRKMRMHPERMRVVPQADRQRARPGRAGGQARRPLAGRDAAGQLPARPGRLDRQRSAAGQRLPLRRRPAGHGLPDRRPRAPRQPARQRRLLRRQALRPPPHHPPRPRLRAAARRTTRWKTTAPTAA